MTYDSIMFTREKFDDDGFPFWELRLTKFKKGKKERVSVLTGGMDTLDAATDIYWDGISGDGEWWIE